MTNQELEICIKEYSRDIYSFCKHLTCDSQEADDLYQDTFTKAIEIREKMDYNNNPKSYLLSIALRIWRNRKRKYAWRKRIADIRPTEELQDTQIPESTETSVEEQVLSRENENLVKVAVDKLPEKLRIVVLLFYMEELTTKEIAIMLKIPAGTVLSRLHQARKVLHEELEDIIDG